MQPGNNYRAGASCLLTTSGTQPVDQATQSDADAINNEDPANLPGAFAGYKAPITWSPMLTVWRKLHVETDSMGPVTGNEIDGPFTDIVGSGTALTEVLGLVSLDDGSKDLDDTPPENGRFENGTLVVGSPPTAITISPVTGNGNKRVVFPVTSIAGLHFLAVDNASVNTMSGTITQITQNSGSSFVWNLNVTASSQTPINWPSFVGGTLRVSGGAAVGITGSSGTTSTGTLTTSGLNIPCVVKDDDDNTLLPKFPDTSQLPAAYKPAYVEPVFDVGDNNLAVAFVLNITAPEAAANGVMDWDSQSLNAADFWVVYLLAAFQHKATNDADPNPETPTLGATPGAAGGSLIYLEVHQVHEGIADPQTEEQITVVHETGHAVGSSNDEPVTIPGGGSVFTSVYLDHIRSSPKPD